MNRKHAHSSDSEIDAVLLDVDRILVAMSEGDTIRPSASSKRSLY